MAREGIERRLTTILAADVVGYSRLMAANEAGTLASLKTLRRELIDPKIAEYGGRVVKLMGDGTLMEFGSVVDAVNFAVDVQRAMDLRNTDVPEDQRITYRIGINIGDIIVEDEDIYGDGVNVASRLEGLAEPGGIYISGKVYEEVRNKLPITFEDLGEQKVKNIPESVRVYRVLIEPEAAGKVIGQTKRATQSWKRTTLVAALVVLLLAAGGVFWWQPWAPEFEPVSPEIMARPLPAKPSIAVLAFDDLSQGDDRDYLSDAISEGIITNLSRYPELFVIARNSSFYYRDNAADIREIARELGVRYLLEGSHQKAGDRLRVTVQLIDAVGGNHVWAETYERDLADFFTVQDEIVRAVSATVGAKLVVVASNEAARADPARLEAFGYWLKGMKYWREFTHEGNLRALETFRKAVEADPQLSRGHSGLAWAYTNGFRHGWTELGRDEALARARETAQRGLDLAPDDYFSHMSMAYVLMQAGESEEAIIKFREALERNANSTDVMGTLAEQLGYVGQGEEAIKLLEEAMRRDPHHPDWVKWTLGWIQYMTGDCENALATMRKMSSLPYVANRTLAAIHVCLGQLVEARAAIADLLAHEPGYSVSDMRASQVKKFRDPADLEHWLDDLRSAGLPE